MVFIQPGDTDERAMIDAKTETSGDNKLQGGGANKWSFESVQNWEFWFPGFRCQYYKENQTKEEGQPHFFSNYHGREEVVRGDVDEDAEIGQRETERERMELADGV